jgi:pyruvate dehydrogenase E2 component (dihydrolipoamide acetyltransferase)
VSKLIDIVVPNIGDFNGIPVIEVLVQAGDVIVKDAPLVTLESEKATMEVPASAGGIVRDVKIKIGDTVSEGTVLASVEVADDATAAVVQAEIDTPPVEDGGSELSEPTPSNTAEAAASSSSSPSEAAAGLVELRVPDIGDFTEIPVTAVFIEPGDTIAREQPLLELESDKATMEVPAEASGTVGEVRIKVGDRVSRGTVIAMLTPFTSASASAKAPAAPPAPAARATPVPPTTNGNANGLASDSGLDVTPSSYGASGGMGSAHASTNGAAAHASPSIRRFARELGVDLHLVRGSGPNGRIQHADVQNFVKTSLAQPRAANGTASTHANTELATGFTIPPWPKVDFAKYGPIERETLSRIKKISGPALTRNWVMIPHVTQHDDADVTELEDWRKSLNAEQKDVKVTMLAFIIKACVAALKEYRNFNSSLDGDELVHKQYYNIGFAADTPNGLVVPVVRNADAKGIFALARETGELAAKARAGKLTPDDMTGGTFTISSLGGIGGTAFTPIINAPEVAILGVSRSTIKPIWDGSAFAPRLLLPLSLSYDHRVIDGASAARFTTYLGQTLADLKRTLL